MEIGSPYNVYRVSNVDLGAPVRGDDDRFKFPAPRKGVNSEATKGGKFKSTMSKLLHRRFTSSSDEGMELSPLRDRTNLRSKSTKNITNPLRGVDRTPPLPTFQRSMPQQPQVPRTEPKAMNTSRRRIDVEPESLPSPTYATTSTPLRGPLNSYPSMTFITAPGEYSTPLRGPLNSYPSMTFVTASGEPSTPTPVARPRRTVPRRETVKIVGENYGQDRVPNVPILPTQWTAQHDHLICLHDGKGHPPRSIIRALEKYDPSLKGVLYQDQIRKRLRILDQIPEVDYWRTPFGSSPTVSANLTIAEANRAKKAKSRDVLQQQSAHSMLGGLFGKGKGKEARRDENPGVGRAISTDERVESY